METMKYTIEIEKVDATELLSKTEQETHEQYDARYNEARGKIAFVVNLIDETEVEYKGPAHHLQMVSAHYSADSAGDGLERAFKDVSKLIREREVQRKPLIVG